ncbi:choice-of-anchor J domain-containing protein [Flavobacterium gelidilacus]
MLPLIILLGFFSTTFVSINAQCIRPDAFGNVVSNNSGLLQGITTCAFSTAEYSTVTGLTLGEDYVFAGQVGTTYGAGTHVYVTITDLSNTVIQHGVSPQTVTNVAVAGVRIHLSDDAACAGSAVCHNTSVLLITSCIVPSGLSSTNVTTTTADISWTAPVNVPSGGYDYYYSTTATAPIATTTPNGTITTGTTANLTALNPSTQYYYWVRSNCGTETSSWSASGTFSTACVAITVPSIETFATFIPACWSKASGGDITAGPATPDAGAWLADGFANVGTTGAVKYNFYTSNTNDWFISPQYVIPATGYEIKFDAAATQYASTAAPTTPWEADDVVEVLISTGTANWSVLYTFDATHAPSNTGSINIIDISAFAGQTVKFAFRMVEGIDNGNADIEFFVDNFQVRLTPSCPEPNGLAVSAITTTSAQLAWMEMGTSTLWNVEYGPAGYVQGSGTSVIGVTTNPYVLSGLTPNTQYDYYVQADCTSSTSYWTGPFSFVTACVPFGSFTENFDTTPSGGLTNCWYKVVNSTDAFARVSIQDNLAFTEPNSAELYNSGDATVTLLLVTPNLTDLPNGTHRLKFRVSGGTNYTMEVGTMSDPTDASTYNAVEPFQAPNGFNEYIVDFSTVTTTDHYIAFKHGSTATFQTIKIDNVVWEPVPASVPSCAANIVVTPDAACGNYATSFVWDPTVGADGYRITIGTTTGGNQVVDNLDLGNVTSYSYTGNFNTTYYYTLTPYNAIGNAVSCTEQSFTTFATGCYCPSVPTSNDGLGITNVQLGTTAFPTTDVTYFSHAATTVTLPQGLNANVQISFATGYTYNTYIWIDFNDNLTFEASEIVYTGESLSTNPTVLNASFVMPAAAALGTHRMRLVSADFLPASDPCYSGSYGVTLDFSVNIIVSTCTPASATTTIVPDCTNNQYSVSVNVTDLGSGSPVLSYGSTTLPITAIGVVTAGPFASGSSNALTILHGSDTTCDLPLGNFTYACPPVNDECANPTVLTPGGIFATNQVTGTNVAATSSTQTAPTCAFYQGGDVWYSAVVPASGSLTFEVNPTTGGLTDTAGAVYSGTCSSLTEIACNDSSSASGDHPLIIVTGQTPGSVLYFRVWEYGNDVFGTFLVSAYDGSLSASSFDNASFVAYPNPVVDVLNLSYSSEISSVKVINLLGQEVISRKVNNTTSQIDMSSLTAGAYIVNVTVGDVVKTIKVIKQ